MPQYVCLVTFTQQGLKHLGATTKRAEAFSQKAEELGAKINLTLWTLGQYDIVHFVEAPDDETATALAVSLGALGNVRTELMRAFDVQEMETIISKVQNPYDLIGKETAT